MVVIGAGFVKLPQVGSSPAATPEAQEPAVAKLIAFRLGGAALATAEATTEATTAPEPAATAEPAAPTETGQTADQTVTMIDIAFNPKEIAIPANTDVAIGLVNNGAAVHSFNVDELNVHSGDYQPGQTGTVTINAAPGDYQYYCAVPGHKEAGMVGTLHVQ
jgi:nitrite reductase (NO-forming)